MTDEVDLRSYGLVDDSRTLRQVLDQLDIPLDRPVLIVVGSADKTFGPAQDEVGLLLRQVVAPTCDEHCAVIITGGTDAGVMSLIGAAVEEFAPRATLVGVAPHKRLIGYGASEGEAGAARPERRHRRLIGSPGACWGDESATLVGVAERVATRRRIAMLAIGGGPGTHREIALAVTRRWPVLLVTGCGGESAAVAARLGLVTGANRAGDAREATPLKEVDLSDPCPPDDPKIVEARERLIAASRALFAAQPVSAQQPVARALRWRPCDDSLLKEAWQRYAVADDPATRGKKPVRRLSGVALLIATLTVLVSITRSVLLASNGAGGEWAKRSLYAVTILPLLGAIVFTWIERRTRSGGWINMRAAAETTLREIYRYRARAGAYRRADKRCSTSADDYRTMLATRC